ncbi:MAG: gluconokinase, partial [Cyanobacteria bacterium J06554_3]
MRYVVGVDIGTSSTKAVLFDANGQQVGRSGQGYVLRSPEPGAAEQDPNDILQATLQTVKAVVQDSGIDESHVLGLAFSAAMHTLLLIDEANQPLTPLFTWADNRSDRLIDAITRQAEQTRPTLYQRTSLPIHPMSPVVKLAWLKQAQPDVFARAARVVSIKEYVLHRWCGEWVIDASIASTTGFFNLEAGDWDAGALEIAGIRPEQLSKIVPTTHLLQLKEEMAQSLGLSAATPVIVGASDGVLSNIGVGAIAAKQAAITLGTSGAIRQVIDRPKTAEAAQLFCYVLDDSHWVMGGAVNNGGIALQWTRDSLVPYSLPPEVQELPTSEPSRSTYERLTKMAEAIAPGSEGLIFHPHILGERAPLWNAQARGNFFGLGRHHTQSHLVRAVMEGVLYNISAVFNAL